MSFGLCRACKWWSHWNEGEFEMRECELDQSLEGEKPPKFYTTINGEGHGWTALFTAPDFGCTEWKPKEPRKLPIQ